MKRRAFLSSGVATGLAVAAISGVAANGQNQRPPESRAKVIEEVSTTRAPKPVGPFSQAIKANGFVFVAGQVARDPKTDQVIDGDITAQTERIMENIKAILEAAGSSLDRTVKTTVFLQDMNDFDAMGKVYARYFPTPQPARSAVQVVRLHGGRIEIELVAVA
jgi:2-iminobutanoate/2-iminopropanoate deaminase